MRETNNLIKRVEDLAGPCWREVAELFEDLPDVRFWIKDAAGRFLWVNREFVRASGKRNRQAILGLTDYDLTAANLAILFRLDDEKVLQGERIAGRAELMGPFATSAVWSSTTKVPLRNPAGAIVGTMGVARVARRPDGPANRGSLGRVFEYIAENLGRPLHNRDLARASGLPLRVFQRRFQKFCHRTPAAYIREVRLRAACVPLAYGKESIAAIARDSGFFDQSHFTRCFRELIGETPAAYRKRNRRQPGTGRR